MDLTGERLIPMPRERVWDALNNIDVLRASIPGCEEIAWNGDNKLEATVTAKIGPVKAKFTGEVELTNINPPESYTISGSGKGGAAGFAKGGADVKLTEVDGGTLLTYEVKAQVGGKLAQVGARMVQGAAKKLSEEFFEAFAAATMASATEEAAPAEAATPAPGAAPAAAETPAEEKAGVPAWAWAAGLAAIVGASLYFWAQR